ncbi:MAG TPA: nucleoside monophosphate kinase [Candidatus Humimicrobiaceae bacterium]|nr:nucleoside monophosphate kinase [Candidatus Humimicrobiaceae bacterium]
MKFPIFKTKTKGVTKKFNLADPKERAAYFRLKAGPEIAKLREYLKKNTFIAYFLGKKNSGKGTYSKMFAEIVSPEKITHFSIGDMIRGVDEELKDKKRKKELYFFLEKNYRGWLPFKKVFSALEKRSTKTLLPSELILALVKREIFRREKKILFIDGFPRDLDQVSYSLFFRDLIGYREDLDVFVLIDVPESVIDERIKWRRVCPKCQTSRNFKLLPTSKIDYDKRKKEFYLVCDNPSCPGAKMIEKEGDKSGIAPIKERLKLDEKLIRQAFSLYGIPKIFLRNSLPVKAAKKFVDDYEITPEYNYQWDEKEKKVRIIEKPWVILDDEGIPSYSLLAAPVTVSLIKQMADVLEL